MADDTQKPAGPGAALIARVPTLSDPELASLNANAQRLKDSGNAQQRVAAAAVLPVIEAEIADRRAKKLAAMPAKAARAKKKAPAKAAAPKSAAAGSAGG